MQTRPKSRTIITHQHTAVTYKSRGRSGRDALKAQSQRAPLTFGSVTHDVPPLQRPFKPSMRESSLYCSDNTSPFLKTHLFTAWFILDTWDASPKWSHFCQSVLSTCHIKVSCCLLCGLRAQQGTLVSACPRKAPGDSPMTVLGRQKAWQQEAGLCVVCLRATGRSLTSCIDPSL